ncbi:cell wall-binding repeat-containing protein [Clostridium bowmanii]|nr:cell wall-binding repeat-containing protein [Clostridium bowmanii]
MSSIAAQKGMPILLTGKNNLPSGVALYLKTML